MSRLVVAVSVTSVTSLRMIMIERDNLLLRAAVLNYRVPLCQGGPAAAVGEPSSLVHRSMDVWMR